MRSWRLRFKQRAMHVHDVNCFRLTSLARHKPVARLVVPDAGRAVDVDVVGAVGKLAPEQLAMNEPC